MAKLPPLPRLKMHEEKSERVLSQGQTKYVLDASDEMILTDFDGDDCRGAGNYFEDEYADTKNHLFSPILFSWPEIRAWFCV